MPREGSDSEGSSQSQPVVPPRPSEAMRGGQRRKSVSFAANLATVRLIPRDQDELPFSWIAITETKRVEEPGPPSPPRKTMRNSFFDMDFSVSKPCDKMSPEELAAMLSPSSAA
ncbi:hypothetical protein BC830DRAFT_1082252 [Chytriomyces sp. MP71]|nr:hypothetical protein BC830DRAFT_1082252 [Chytriomyces sp. MP71]